MEILRCPACGWPTPKGRPCPRGCSATTTVIPPLPAAAPPATVPYMPRTQQEQALPVVYATADSRMARQRAAGPSGLGGWLILPIIGLIVTLGWSAWRLVHDIIPMFGSEAWAGLTTPGAAAYHYMWQPWILFDTFALIVLVLGPLALLTLIFRRRRCAPRWVIGAYSFFIAAQLIDSGIALLVMPPWLRSAGAPGSGDSVTATAIRGLLQAAVLAAIWIPYFLGSRRVKNTFVEPRSQAAPGPVQLVGIPENKRDGRGRLGAAAAVAAIIIVAGAAVFALNTFEGSAAGGTEQALALPAAGSTLLQKAQAAYGVGEFDKGRAYYDQAIQADPADTQAYQAKWSAEIEQGNYESAEDVATRATKQFPTSRLAWYQLGYAQEALFQFPAAIDSYQKCLQCPAAEPNPSGTPVTDADVQKRMDLVSYMVGITAPRQAIAAAIGTVQTAFKASTPDKAAVSAVTAQAITVLTDNLSALEQVQVPAHFAEFNSSMLTAYRDLKTACDTVAAAAARDDASVLTSAHAGLESAVDRFNENDKQGSTLVQSYYQS
jgi:tetratricopeptide (TPR) repeat protein